VTLLYPLIFLFLPRLWSVNRRHGYVTAAEFVRGRFDNRPLALTVALTGTLVTVPDTALQLVGMQPRGTRARYGVGQGVHGRGAGGCDATVMSTWQFGAIPVGSKQQGAEESPWVCTRW
jgi:hypothetical protein